LMNTYISAVLVRGSQSFLMLYKSNTHNNTAYD
jgi:hypothetical protein